MSIREGPLEFNFPPQVAAQKYDGWSFHKRHMSHVCDGSKGVDIMVFDQARVLWLIEIKDYRKGIKEHPDSLEQDYCKKVKDSLAGLLTASVKAHNDEERNFAAHACANLTNIRLVLHLEQPQKPSKLYPMVREMANLTQSLRKQLRAIDPRLMVLNTDLHSNDLPWTVQDN